MNAKKLVPLEKLTADSFYKQPLRNNKFFKYQGNTVCFTRWIKSNLLYVKDIFNESGLKPITDIGRILQNKQNWLCEYRILHKIFSNGNIKLDMCLLNTDAPGGNKLKIWQKSLSPTF